MDRNASPLNTKGDNLNVFEYLAFCITIWFSILNRFRYMIS